MRQVTDAEAEAPAASGRFLDFFTVAPVSGPHRLDISACKEDTLHGVPDDTVAHLL